MNQRTVERAVPPLPVSLPDALPSVLSEVDVHFCSPPIHYYLTVSTRDVQAKSLGNGSTQEPEFRSQNTEIEKTHGDSDYSRGLNLNLLRN